MNPEKKSVFVKSWGGVNETGWMGQEHMIFKAVKILCMMLGWWIHVIIHWSKPVECTTLSEH